MNVVYWDEKNRVFEKQRNDIDHNLAVEKQVINNRKIELDNRNAKLDTKTFELEASEREFATRVQNFEDILSMSPILVKSNGDASLLREALINAKITKKK
jgi:hypothetical protein